MAKTKKDWTDFCQNFSFVFNDLDAIVLKNGTFPQNIYLLERKVALDLLIKLTLYIIIIIIYSFKYSI